MFAVLIYQKAFRDYSYGYAAALSWIMLVFVLILTGVLFFLRRFTYGGDED